MLKIFFAGWVILIVAVFINLIAQRLGLSSWYYFLNEAEKNGLGKAFNQLTNLSKVYLLLVYPTLLGIAGYFSFKLIK